MRLAQRLTLVALLIFPTFGTAQAPLHIEREILLPGVEGRIDHFSIDLQEQRLFVSALGNGTVEVIDLKAGQRSAEIKGLKEPQGVLFEPATNRLYVACGADGTLRAYDGKTLALLKSILLADDADNLRYDAANKLVLVGYGSGALAGFDAAYHRVFEIPLPAHPESFQLEKQGSRIFVNLPSNLSLGVIDRPQKKLTDKWHSSDAAANFSMALDESDKRLLIAYRLPARLVIFNTETGKPTATQPIVGDTDDLFLDEVRHRLYVTGGEGFLDVLQQSGLDKYTRLAKLPTASGARTGLFVPELDRLFVAVPHRGSQEAKILVFAPQ